MILTWLNRRRCMHHDPRTGESFIRSQLVEFGAVKLTYCCRCGRYFR